jgi:hypothetical protein
MERKADHQPANGQEQVCIGEENRKVVECVLHCIIFLACEMIAFWGDKPTEGKFMNLFRLVAKRDASAAAYLMKVDKSYQSRTKMPVKFLSSANVRLALLLFKELIVERIVQEIATQKKACIIFDSTQDFSKKEASVLLMRYLQPEHIKGDHVITERLLRLFTTGETSGAGLHDKVVATSNRINFDKDWLVGQCYDGAGNMRGKYSGLATHLQKTCPKAIYIWCNAHRLNLVMNSVTNCCRDVKNTLGLLEELHVFMNGHKRNDVFMQAQQGSKIRKKQLKRVSTTRWNNTEAATETVLSKYQEVLETLKLLSQPDYDIETATQATGLLARLQDFRVILCIHVLKTIYSYIGPASRVRTIPVRRPIPDTIGPRRCRYRYRK